MKNVEEMKHNIYNVLIRETGIEGVEIIMRNIIKICAAAALLLPAVGCQKKEFSAAALSDKRVIVKASDADAASEASTQLTVDEGEYVIIHPELENKSAVHVILQEKGNTALDETITGKVIATYETIKPGTYELTVSANEGCTGVVEISAESMLNN